MPILLIILAILALPVNASEVIIAEETEDIISAEEPTTQKRYGKLRILGLNKITARSEELTAPIGAVTRFGNLEIIPRGCWVAPANKRPEQAGLLEVWYWKQGEEPTMIFFGWMFSSSPALSSLEHPIYDITMLECIERKQPKQEEDNVINKEIEDNKESNDSANP